MSGVIIGQSKCSLCHVAPISNTNHGLRDPSPTGKLFKPRSIFLRDKTTQRYFGTSDLSMIFRPYLTVLVSPVKKCTDMARK